MTRHRYQADALSIPSYSSYEHLPVNTPLLLDETLLLHMGLPCLGNVTQIMHRLTKSVQALTKARTLN